MAGILLCVFFALGVITGFSESGRRLAQRLSRLVRTFAAHALAGAVKPASDASGYFRQELGPRRPERRASDAVALVEKRSGFYVLSAAGVLTGPASPAASPDLPVLSGPGVEAADGTRLVRDAALVVRAEAGLSRLISELRVEGDGTEALFLDRARTEIVLGPGEEPREIRCAARVLRRWRGRERLIAKLDLTASGLAVVTLDAGMPRFQERRAVSSRRVRSGPGGGGMANARVAQAGAPMR